jgi:hypothetical protein
MARLKPRGLPPDPDDDWNEEPTKWEDAAEQCQTIYDKIEDADGDIWDKAYEFFESIQSKVKDMKESIEGSRKVTDGQKAALDNMEAGVDRWLNDE